MRFRRLRRAGGTYFFTVVTLDRRPILIQNIDRLREAFRRTRARQPFVLEAAVILPDHLHTIWRLPPDDADYAGRWQRLKHYFTTGIPADAGLGARGRKRERRVWQRRYWEHLIRDEDDLRRHLDYVHYNPVKHGCCAAPDEWPYSSFGRLVRRGSYPADWGRTAPAGLEGLECE